MPLYENDRNAQNRIKVKKEWSDAVVFGTYNTINYITSRINEKLETSKKTVTVAFDGWYGVDWHLVIDRMQRAFSKTPVKLTFTNINSVFLSEERIAKYKKAFLSDDPSFGMVNTDGCIEDLMDQDAVQHLRSVLKNSGSDVRKRVHIVYGCGSAVPVLSDTYDIIFYFDTTKQSVLWKMWGGELFPFGADNPKQDYWWKEYYYCDFYLLNEQKHFALKQMDYYVQAVEVEELNIIPREAFDGILSTLVQYPTKNVKYAQPGPWGAYRFRDTRWDIPELSNNAWNAAVSPNELAVTIDIGREKMLKMPAENLMQYPKEFVGPYIHKTYPRLIPFYIWIDDGYFPEPQPAERTSMPIHNHPSTDYVKRHFREPMGRYETYYIAEAYEGANTWMGFKDDADLEEWERRCRESEKTGEPIENWKDFVANWETNVGDLFIIPPGTSHGHGGNQMVVEMDTVPSVAGTEYSFIGYNYLSHGWDDEKKSMTARPMNLQLEHYFDNEKWRRESWVKEHLRVRPGVVKWTKEYAIDRYDSLPEMPFEIERIHFLKKAQYSTEGRFLHMVVLTAGEKVRIQSKKNPEYGCDIEWLQGAAIPACFGDYEYINLDRGMCTIVLIRWKRG